VLGDDNMKLSEIDIRFKISDVPSSIPVFNVAAATFENRRSAIEHLGKKFSLGKSYTIEVEESMFIIAKEGMIQFYGPSGALWARNFIADSKYKDERRPWKTEKIDTDDDYDLLLPESAQKKLVSEAQEVLKESEMLSEYSYFVDVSLDQITKLDESGKEIERFPGEATARFLYRIDNIPVEGGGAKSYLFFNPTKEGHELTGLYHAWREPMESKLVKLMDIERGLEQVLRKDKELLHYHEKDFKLRLDGANLVYYSLPPHKNQRVLFPVFNMTGSFSKRTKEGQDGFAFSKYFHAVNPRDYMDLDIQAYYLASRR